MNMFYSETSPVTAHPLWEGQASAQPEERAWFAMHPMLDPDLVEPPKDQAMLMPHTPRPRYPLPERGQYEV